MRGAALFLRAVTKKRQEERNRMRLYATPQIVTALVLMTGANIAHAGRPEVAKNYAAVRVLYAGKPLPSAPDLRPYRDPEDNMICVSPESLERVGIHYSIGADDRVTLSLPDNDVFQRVVSRSIPGIRGQFVPVVEVIEGFGGRVQWDSATGTLHILPVLTGVRFDGDQVLVKSSLPLRTPRVTKQDDGTRLIFDFDGTDVGELGTRKLGPVEGNVNGAKAVQSGRTARLILSLAKPMRYASTTSDSPTQLAIGPTTEPVPMKRTPGFAAPSVVDQRIIAEVVPDDPRPTPAPVKVAAARKPIPTLPSRKATRNMRSVSTRAGVPPAGISPTSPPFVPPSPVESLTELRFNSDNPEKARMFLGGSMSTFPLRVRNLEGRLVVDLPTAALGSGLADKAAGFQHPLFSSVKAAATSNGATRLTLETTKPVNYQFKLRQDGGGMLLDVTPQGEGDLPLKGRTVVVDPGHGGHDKGAPGVNGTREALNTLAMSRILVEELRLLGADVILNRDSDVFIELSERGKIANRQGADFFISVHCDSAGSSAQGSTAYYHLSEEGDRTLAQCIANRLAVVGDIGTRGAKSDGRIYSTGFAVLRHSQMTGVLVETGFMSNWRDAEALATEGTRRKLMQAVAGGLADFVKANPGFPSKDAKSGSGGQLYIAPDDQNQ
jgi:N-acetylmuramoyl-L-alanine amidase